MTAYHSGPLLDLCWPEEARVSPEVATAVYCPSFGKSRTLLILVFRVVDTKDHLCKYVDARLTVAFSQRVGTTRSTLLRSLTFKVSVIFINFHRSCLDSARKITVDLHHIPDMGIAYNQENKAW